MKRLGERAGCEGLRDCVYVCVDVSEEERQNEIYNALLD